MELPLNAGLVSIIGQQGSGKSALAELIAYAAGSWEADSPDRFLTRAGKHLEGLEILLERGDGSESGIARLKRMGSDTCPRSSWSGSVLKTISEGR